MFGSQRHADDLDLRLADQPACTRCHSVEHLLIDDGPIVCWPCALAWGSFAGLVTGGPTSIEPVMVAMCRTGHHQPRPGCAWCRERLGEQRAPGLPGTGPNRQRGPAG